MNPQTIFIEAMLTHCDIWEHLPFLKQVAKGNVLEIGVRYGASTSAFLLGIEECGGHLTSIDINPSCGELFSGNPNWTFIHGNSLDIDVYSRAPKILDILFLDGDHSYSTVSKELALYGPLVKHGGCILMHDVAGIPDEPYHILDIGCMRAFSEYVMENSLYAELRPDSHGLGVIKVA